MSFLRDKKEEGSAHGMSVCGGGPACLASVRLLYPWTGQTWFVRERVEFNGTCVHVFGRVGPDRRAGAPAGAREGACAPHAL